jgi:hypothetical protein
MGTTLTHQQRVEREKQVKSLIQKGTGVVGIAAALNVTKQAVWQFCAVRGWLDDVKGNDAKIKAKAKEAAERQRKTRKKSKSGLDDSSAVT